MKKLLILLCIFLRFSSIFGQQSQTEQIYENYRERLVGLVLYGSDKIDSITSANPSMHSYKLRGETSKYVFKPTILNFSDKIIKYVTFSWRGYNAVDDPIGETLKRKGIGPIELIGTYEFDVYDRNEITSYIKINSINIEYTDGTSKYLGTSGCLKSEEALFDVHSIIFALEEMKKKYTREVFEDMKKLGYSPSQVSAMEKPYLEKMGDNFLYDFNTYLKTIKKVFQYK